MGFYVDIVRLIHPIRTPSDLDLPSYFSWMMLKYPLPKDRRVALAKLYFHLSVTPGMSTEMVSTCADAFKTLTKSKHKITIDDMRLPWKPIYDILGQDLFLSRRQFEYT